MLFWPLRATDCHCTPAAPSGRNVNFGLTQGKPWAMLSCPFGARSLRARLLSACPSRSAAETREVHQAGGLSVGFLNPFDDVRRVRRIFELDGDRAVDVQFLDSLEIRLEFDDAAAGRQVAVDFAVAIADVDMDGFAFELDQLERAGVSQHEVTDVDIGADARVAALVHETRHGDHAVEQAQPEGLQLECDIDSLLVGVIAEDATGLDGPAPLLGRRDDFSLPNVFAEHKENVLRSELSSKVDEGLAALHVEGTYGFVEVGQAGRDHGKRNDGQVAFPARVQHQVFFLWGNGHGLCEDVHAIEADAGDVLEADCGVHAGLAEGAVDDSKFHRFWVFGTLKTKFGKLHRPALLR